MGTLVVFRKAVLEAVLPLDPNGTTLGMGPGGSPAALPPGQEGGVLRFTPRGEGVQVVALPGAAKPAINGRPCEGATMFAGDSLTLGTWTIHPSATLEAPGGGGDPEVQRALFKIVASATSKDDAAELLAELLQEAVTCFQAERAFVLYRPSSRAPMAPAASHQITPEELGQRISQTAIEQALEAGHPVLIGDAESELADAESVQAEGIRSILCAPLGKDGALYLDSRAAARAYDTRDLQLFTTFAGYAQLALQLFKESDALRLDAERARATAGAPSAGKASGRLVVGDSPRMRALVEELDAVAGEEVTVLILGETGTGKEVLAREVHERSRRAGGPFIPVNCMAFAGEVIASELFGHEKGAFTGATERRRGRFELADGGTLFLDELGELSLEVQVKLLRVLQERVVERVGGDRPIPVDIRIVAATNRDLEEAVREGTFREDLYYRLNVFSLAPPPLRHRCEDIPALAAHFVAQGNERMGKSIEGLTDEALEVLQGHSWPGNVRELANVIERALVLEKGPKIRPAALPFRGGARPAPGGATATADDFLTGLPSTLAAAREEFERLFIGRALEQSQGKIAAAARTLGIPRSTIYRKAEQLGLDVGGKKDG